MKGLEIRISPTYNPGTEELEIDERCSIHLEIIICCKLFFFFFKSETKTDA